MIIQKMHSAFYLLVLLFLPVFSHSQEKAKYPLWFLEQERVACPTASVGYATLSYYTHNGIMAAWNNAVENRARYEQFSITGGEAFVKTDHGTISQGNSYREVFDSSGVSATKAKTPVLDSAFTPGCIVVLSGDSSYQVPSDLQILVDVSSRPAPEWITTIPEKNGYIYSVGVEEQNYYEVSCWTEAEKNARIKLARSYKITLQSVAKMSTYSGQEVQNEEMAATIRNAEILRRWRDTGNNIYYVLMRCKISQ